VEKRKLTADHDAVTLVVPNLMVIWKDLRSIRILSHLDGCCLFLQLSVTRLSSSLILRLENLMDLFIIRRAKADTVTELRNRLRAKSTPFLLNDDTVVARSAVDERVHAPDKTVLDLDGSILASVEDDDGRARVQSMRVAFGLVAVALRDALTHVQIVLIALAMLAEVQYQIVLLEGPSGRMQMVADDVVLDISPGPGGEKECEEESHGCC